MPATIWKVLNKNSPGTSGTFAADDWDMPGRYFGDVDLTATAPASIKTNTSFWDNRLRIWNPAKTKSYRIRGLAIVNDYDLTLPLLSSNDEIVGLIATQTLQNKQINVNNNTLKHGTTNAIGDLLVGTGTKYDRFAMGSTGGYVLAIKNDLTGLEWISAPGGGSGEANTASNVGTGGVGVFKLKSGVNLQFKKINTASGGLITVTDDTTNSEIDLGVTGGTNGQILKTVGTTPTWSTSDTDISLKSQLNQKWGDYALTTATGGAGIFTGYLSSTGTHSIITPAGTNGLRARFTTGAVSGNQAGIRTTGLVTVPTNNPRLEFRGSSSTTNVLVFIGFVSLSGSFPTGTTNPLQDLHGVGIWMNSSTTNVRFIHNDGTGPSVHEDVSPTTTMVSGAGGHTSQLYTDDAGASWHLVFNGTDNIKTVEIPNTSTPLTMIAYTETQAASATSFDIRALGFRGAVA